MAVNFLMQSLREPVPPPGLFAALRRSLQCIAVPLALALALVGTSTLQSVWAQEDVQVDQFNIDVPSKGHKSFGRAGSVSEIPCLTWKPRDPKLVMLCIHGFGLHKGTYDSFARELAKRGVAVYAIDMRGFGHWVQKGSNRIDFDASLNDIGLTLLKLRELHPNLKIIVLGESMGGAIAMKTAAKYPDYVDGLISSVPAGDRYDNADSELGVVKHAFMHGMDAPLDVGPAVVGAATKKSDLRRAWLSDPLARTRVTPNELLSFNKFMNKTFVYAPKIENVPVLFIQGCKDKLVRPAGTWKLFNRLSTRNKQLVLSKTAEHLIFEGGQYSDEDLNFVLSWIDGSLSVDLIPVSVASGDPRTRRIAKVTAGDDVNEKPAPKQDRKSRARPDKERLASASIKPPAKKASLTYWIELKRNGKKYRCNNKTQFRSGDAIRFHVMPDSDGYAYIVLNDGSSGKGAVLFPSSAAGKANYLRKGVDYPLPYKAWIAFDNNPGLEKLRIMFSRKQIDIDKVAKPRIAYVSADNSGAKDLVGTGLQLSWSDPNPVIMPDEIEAATREASSSKVRLTFDNPDGTLAVDVALQHH